MQFTTTPSDLLTWGTTSRKKQIHTKFKNKKRKKRKPRSLETFNIHHELLTESETIIVVKDDQKAKNTR